MAEIVHENKIQIALKVRDKSSLNEQSIKLKKHILSSDTMNFDDIRFLVEIFNSFFS